MTQTLIERINIKKLRCLVKNLDELKDMIGNCKDMKTYKKTDYEGTKTILKSYLASKDKNGCSKVIYDFSKGNKDGRLFSKTHSLQGLPRAVRHTISSDIMIDVDIKNCHPEIFKWYCRNNGIPCENLCYYIENRDNCLSDITNIFQTMTKDDAKTAVLSIINGGNGCLDLNKSPEWFRSLAIEVSNAHERVAKNFPHYVSAIKRNKGEECFNINGKACNKMFCLYEGIILNHMADFAVNNGLEIGSLCFDGLMIYKMDDFDLEPFLVDMENYVFNKVGIQLKIVQKEMTEGIDLTKYNIEEEFDLLPPIVKDDYYFNDFYMERNKVFSNLEELIYFFKQRFPLVCQRVSSGDGGYYLKKTADDERYDKGTINLFGKQTNFRYMGWVGDKEVELSSDVNGLFELCELPTYAKIVCKPKTDTVLRGELNIWEPFLADVPRDVNIEKVEPILKYMREIIADGDEALFKYLVSWLRHICKYPWKKTGKVIVLQSDKQRAGKGTFVNWFAEFVLGRNHWYGTSLMKLTGKFNSFLLGRSLIVVDELPKSKSFHTIWDSNKSLVTERYMDVEFKGREPMKVDNIMNEIMMTNNRDALKIEKEDGRYIVYKINESKVGDVDFWDYCYNELFTQDRAIDFFNYLVNMDDTDELLVSIQRIPTSELREEMIETSLNSYETFLNDIRKRDIPGFRITLSDESTVLLEDIPIEKPVEIKKADLYSQYVNYCAIVGAKVKEWKFIKMILPEKVAKRGGKSVRVVHI
jgi:hypothetical protein